MPTMAQTIVVIDDIDGSSNARTVSFSYDNKSYEIDLSKKNLAALEKALKPYVEAGRKTTGRGRRGSPRPSSRRNGRGFSSSDLAEIRAWAHAHGHRVAERGRIPKKVVDAYHESMG
jgi:hypothetical protein